MTGPRLLKETTWLVPVMSAPVEAPVRIETSLRPGLAFMTLHFPDQVDSNQLTIDATDPKSGTAEFKASAIRVEKVEHPEQETAAPEAAVAGLGD